VKMPLSSGYAAVNGIELYYEVHGAGRPLVLLPGGLTTIGEMEPLLGVLSLSRQVIGVELQGHGHTADTDRPLAWSTMADDIAGLLDHLEIRQADILGYSLGGGVALQVAIRHAARVRRLILMSTSFARNNWYPEALDGMSQVSAGMAEQMADPTAVLSRAWPEPELFPRLLDKLGRMLSEDYDWSDEVRRLTMPVMLAYADHDSIPPRQQAEFFALLGGGLKEPGWLDTQFTNARLAVIPGYSHYNFTTASELGSMVDRFLTDPIDAPSAGPPAAASTVA
jgi:pimeloyl-ACP methyl ester carboxylesterase